jgi:ribonuclease HII
MSVLGIDEAGRGPVIGPMVVAGVLVDDDAALRKLQVKDSKLLNPEQREALYARIIPITKQIIKIIPPKTIDAAVEGNNLNWLEADVMVEMISMLKPTITYLDCPSPNIKKFSEYIRERVGPATQVIAEHKADAKYPVVSAASILAKVTRDRQIAKLHEVYGDFGSGYPSDPRTQEFLAGNPQLPIYRRSWSSWQRVAQSKEQKKIGDF